jgi:uracil-DNA glycosylase
MQSKFLSMILPPYMLTHTTEKLANTSTEFNLDQAHISWRDCLLNALSHLDANYLATLTASTDWLPGHRNIFSAFSIPVSDVQYVLFGESPYPRAASANGYAFWDNAVTDLWSATGLSKPVNRATSLRNILKMLLLAADKLPADRLTQPDIAALPKADLIQTNQQLFGNLLAHGFLLLNATPILRNAQVRQDARAWQPFLKEVLQFLLMNNTKVEFILFGNIANEIDAILPNTGHNKIYAEHPYNISFIKNPVVLDFFRPLHLLKP